jgi:hypothetical protein
LNCYRERERLAKVSGIVIAHPGLHLEVEAIRTPWAATNTTRSSQNRASGPRLSGAARHSDGVIVSRGLGKTARRYQ